MSNIKLQFHFQGSHEYAPGIRMNHAMIPVIDCYPAEKVSLNGRYIRYITDVSYLKK